MRNIFALVALALAACSPIQTQTAAIVPPKNANAVTLSATVETSDLFLTADKITISINGDPVIKGYWASSLKGQWRDRSAWAKCHSRINLLRNIGSEIYCDVYIDDAFIGQVSATEE